MFIGKIGAAFALIAYASAEYTERESPFNTLAASEPLNAATSDKVAKGMAAAKKIAHKVQAKAKGKAHTLVQTSVSKKASKAKVSHAKRKVHRAKHALKHAKKRLHKAKSKGAKLRAKKAIKRNLKRLHKAEKHLKKISKSAHKHHHHARVNSRKSSDSIATILKLGRKVWHNSVWAKIAAGKDTMSFMHQTAQAERALKHALQASAPILRNPRGHFHKSQLKMIKSKMDQAYAESLRAEEGILMAQGRMQIMRKHVPHGIVSHHIKKQLKSRKKALHKIIKKIRGKINKHVQKLAKHLAKKAAKHHNLKKDSKKIRKHVMKKVHALIKKLHKKLVSHVGKNAAKSIIKHVVHSAARKLVIAVHKVAVVHHNHEAHAFEKLKAVGRKVAEEITKETLAAHKSRKVAARQGEMAGRASIKFASTLVLKQLVKRVGAKRAHEMIRRVIHKANSDAKHHARRTARGHKSHHGRKHHKSKRGKSPNKKSHGKGKKLLAQTVAEVDAKAKKVMNMM